MKLTGIAIGTVFLMLLLTACSNSLDSGTKQKLEDLNKDLNNMQQKLEKEIQQASTCSNNKKDENEQGVDCGGVCQQECQQHEAGQKQQNQSKEQEKEEKKAGYELTETQKQALKDKIKLNKKIVFLSNSYPKGISVGQSHVFAFAIVNTEKEEKSFKPRIEFLKAINPSNNKIEGIDETINSWFSENSYKVYSLESYGYELLPVSITAQKKIGKDKETEPGTYYFRLWLDELSTADTWKSDIWEDFSIRVK